MASGGKKKNKTKGKTLALTEFLANDDGTVPAPVVNRSWAAEVENADQDEFDDRQPIIDRSKLPTAPKAARGPDVDLLSVPTVKPFTAFVGNLPYDATESKILDFFRQQNLQVENVRLPNENGRQRGFGYVEFETRQDLLDALTLNECVFLGRKLRVDLAEQNQGQNQGERDRERDGRSDRDDWRSGGDPNRSEGDWRRKDPPSFNDDRGGGQSDRSGGYSERSGGGFSDRSGDRFGDRYGERQGDSYGDRDRRSGFSDRSSYNDRGSDRYGDRRGGGRYGGDRGGFGGDRSGGGGGGRYGDEDRYGGGRRGFSDRYRDGDRDERRYDDDRGFGGRRTYGGGYRREDGGGGDRYRSDMSRGDRPNSRETSQEGPKERPKLNLQPRSKPIETTPSQPAPRQSSIFGGAKPVDTAAKEREIEEKLKKMDAELHYPSQLGHDDDKENRQSLRDGPPKESRPRRDSERSDGSRGRDRRSSGSSSKTSHSGPPPYRELSRRDSETSRNSEDSHPTQDFEVKPLAEKEEVKMVPAPPPKENAWSRPRRDDKHEPVRQLSSDHVPDQNKHSEPVEERRDKDRRDGETRRDKRSNFTNDRRRGFGREGDRYESKQDRPNGQKRGSREKPLPKSIDEMPKLDQGPPKDWADTNKFAYLGGEDEGYDDDY